MRVGTDIIEISRVQAAATPAFLSRVFTPEERAYYESKGKRAEVLAGLFCAKEAAAKALGGGFRGFTPADIEIGHTAEGAPTVALCGAAKALYPHARLQVSISHCREYATATALCEDA